uniref:AlNc14C4G608 protein n=1 Tax=Albugo laibachii Nc14 TaxID=890382 RepID=F0W0G6_9STRA|nr:AlNc14C4G608 [Albugo laibachii Nc14]|eukprot:CCA14538.1 AlNc14C4G608 [Albugo laibachii Nc14]
MDAATDISGLSIKRASDQRYFGSYDEIFHLLRAEALTNPSKKSSSASNILHGFEPINTTSSAVQDQSCTSSGSRSGMLQAENNIPLQKDKCIVCRKSFGLLKRRKHTCRVCDRITCSQCAVDRARRNPDTNSCSFCERNALEQDPADQITAEGSGNSADSLKSDKQNGCRAVYLRRNHNHQIASMKSNTTQRSQLFTQRSHWEPITLLSTSDIAVLGHEQSSKSRR